MEKAVEDLDATCTEAEASAGETEPPARSACATLADAGFNPIIARRLRLLAGGRQGRRRSTPTSTSRSSTASAPRPKTANDNVADLVFAEEQGSFLVGVAAALKTKAKHVGFVGGVARRR